MRKSKLRAVVVPHMLEVHESLELQVGVRAQRHAAVVGQRQRHVSLISAREDIALLDL